MFSIDAFNPFPGLLRKIRVYFIILNFYNLPGAVGFKEVKTFWRNWSLGPEHTEMYLRCVRPSCDLHFGTGTASAAPLRWGHWSAAPACSGRLFVGPLLLTSSLYSWAQGTSSITWKAAFLYFLIWFLNCLIRSLLYPALRDEPLAFIPLPFCFASCM